MLPTTTPLDIVCRQVLHLSRTMLTISHCLCGSFCLRLASTFNHRPVMYSYYIYISYFCHLGTIMIFFILLISFLYSTFRKKTCFFYQIYINFSIPHAYHILTFSVNDENFSVYFCPLHRVYSRIKFYCIMCVLK